MASILDLLNTTIGEELITKASRKSSESKENVSIVLALALPMLLGGMKKNISNETGAKQLDQALADERHGEEQLKNFSNIDSSGITEEGEKIIQHIFGDDSTRVFQTVSSTIGIKKSSVEEIFKLASPVVLNVLSSQKKKEKLEASGLGDLISSVMGTSSQFDSSLVETLLIKDHDSNVINNAKEMILGGGTKGKKDGGILGGMLGSK